MFFNLIDDFFRQDLEISLCSHFLNLCHSNSNLEITHFCSIPVQPFQKLSVSLSLSTSSFYDSFITLVPSTRFRVSKTSFISTLAIFPSHRAIWRNALETWKRPLSARTVIATKYRNGSRPMVVVMRAKSMILLHISSPQSWLSRAMQVWPRIGSPSHSPSLENNTNSLHSSESQSSRHPYCYVRLAWGLATSQAAQS